MDDKELLHSLRVENEQLRKRIDELATELEEAIDRADEWESRYLDLQNKEANTIFRQRRVEERALAAWNTVMSQV